MNVAFFDRDGTIIEDYEDHEWARVKKPVFMDGAIETLDHIQKQGYTVIIITNQYLINEGYISYEQYETINSSMLHVLKEHNISIQEVFYCPHRRDEGCRCIKPNVGMIEQALMNYPEIRLDHSFIVGDSKVDVDLATKLGIRGYGIRVTNEQPNVTLIDTISDLQFVINKNDK
ncbi:HAD-IIIA family hydrolase [Geomicrobium sp. JCM 19055]|uniref:D-glycero-alpha-D-manno-heptose-1,7-bisphosphate 7-phosphatase n=1 Tax=Geomicrobium sp. JCM 19055 TaxID=1460649 RepID=UPI00045ED45C|nr:HAD-IIIA family hydrolase [Geomicrobium sp. JCM 19055]GAK01237.1 D-glycero-D-manno-heptose 1,7-bisphosphate phosphatase [Geomicrobium sp. JCM 19055]